MFSYYFLYFELASLVVALVMARKLWGSPFFLFIPFLLLTNVQEWGSHYGLFSIHKSNSLSLNIFTNIEFVFYAWFFYRYTEGSDHKRRILILTAIYIILAVTNILFIQGVYRFHSFSYLIGSMLMVYYVCYFFYALFNGDAYVDLLRYPVFWVCVGLFVFYLGMFTYYAFFELVAVDSILKYIVLFNVLMNIFNIVLYSCFSMAFLCHRPKTTIS